ncbi:CPBP family intramembrane glutamic endopeptidase [Propioniciclava sinopodophylli]|uniref:CPBP family intramembrane glutamic endopeptidase n=1 Tax=Propioniciclava sinopodophylli TaxID=1837344 RepID=UPI002490027F|nr:CPBP family intramembrane glutamic endopeptidase [Propioniciclava sinopodophylli]
MADSKRRRIAGPVEASFTARHATEKVPVGVDYTQVLRTPNASPAASLMGVMLGLLTFMVLTPLVSQAMAALYWLATGRPGEFTDTYRSLVAYEVPFGLVVGHAGLAMLIPISIVLVLLIHRVRPGYLSSVSGHIRWRWFFLTLALGFAALWLVLLVQNLTMPGGPNWAITPQAGALWFILVMLVTTPIQAAAEEYFFRGYLMQSLGSLVASPWFGIVVSAAVFTLFHASTNLALVLDRFAFGVLAGWLVVRTGGLEAAIGAHIANNVSAFGLAALTSSMAEVKAITEVTWAAAAWDVGRFAFFALLIWLLARGYRPATVTLGLSRTPTLG